MSNVTEHKLVNVLVDKIKFDADNPNEMSDEQMTADGEIEVELNRKVITERISDLYKNPKSGLRELLMNAFRACRVARVNAIHTSL